MSSEKRPYVQRARAEREQATRQRIIEATVELHRELGPARTTVAEIARRAGVNRLTVRNHFPDDRDLFRACQAEFRSNSTAPDFAATVALEDPGVALRETLRALYRDYQARASMTAKLQRDRRGIPALDKLLRQTRDRDLQRLSAALTDRLGEPRNVELTALVSLALDFFTFETLARAGLDPDSASAVMGALVLSHPAIQHS